MCLGTIVWWLFGLKYILNLLAVCNMSQNVVMHRLENFFSLTWEDLHKEGTLGAYVMVIV